MHLRLPSPPAWSIKGRRTTNHSEASPGPGTYQPSGIVSSPSFKMGRSSRSDFGVSEAPGPGAYTLSPRTAGPCYSIKGRYEQPVREVGPGPGSYASSFTNTRPQSAKVGKASRANFPSDSVKNSFPGPGSYCMNSSLSGPQWKMAQDRRLKSSFEQTPGPGSYKIHSTLSKISHYLSGRPRNLEKERSPGPAAYTVGSFAGSPSFKMGTAKRRSGNSFDSPGPGSYNCKSSLAGPNYSMKGRLAKSAQNEVPGPGTYSARAISRPLSARFGTATRGAKSHDDVPGPGTYTDSAKKIGPEWRFGSGSRGSLMASDAPGPGAYHVGSSLSKQAYSMTGRKPLTDRDFTPGPGAYKPSALLFDSSPQYKMGKAARSDFVTNKDCPGPGTYSLQSLKDGPQYSMKSRTPLKSADEVPGPGSYSVASFLRPQSAKFGTASRDHLLRESDMPGPGAYSFNSPTSSPQWKFGNSTRKRTNSEFSPGPGSYQINSTLSKRGVSMSGRVTITSKDQSPGPGAYSFNSRTASPHWKFGNSTRNRTSSEISPGPGSYKLNSTLSKKGISMSGRFETPTKDRSPGPGSYKLSSTLSNKGVSMSGRIHTSSKDHSPGPGAYTYEKPGTSSGYRFGSGKRLASNSGDLAPGPGAYSPLKKDGSGHSFGKEARGGMGGHGEGPGPGSYMYNIPSSLGGWTMSPKFRQKEVESGPLYNPKVQPNGPHWGFGTGMRGDMNRDESPGPAAYNIGSSIANIPNYARR